ncbi:MAG TPA: hypothetical protein VF530_06300 [Planctomycetota bacterium]
MQPCRALWPILLLAACHTDAPTGTRAPAPPVAATTAAQPPAPARSAEPAPPPAEETRGQANLREMRGAPYARATTPTLAVLAPREASGAEADARPRRAFLALNEKEQRDLLEWFGVECEKLGTFQWTLIRYVLDSEEQPRDAWPALGPLSWYDPEVHTPGLPIPRFPLAPDSAEVVAVRNQLLHAPGTRRLDSGWLVDYGARTLVRLPHEADPVRLFENALLGMIPDWDLVEAMVELRLDDGALQDAFRAFGHAYTDRWGGVYPGVTLYDAQASLLQVEMPDVDALGVLHDLRGDWTSFTSPVPAEQHAELYALVAELFKPLLHHRGLRASLARTYLCGSAELRDSYRYNLDNLHALWESAASDPAALLPRLPDETAWRDFLQSWHDHLTENPELFLRGTSRHAQLERDAQAVRATMLRLLDEYGAIARIETLPPFDE